MRSYERQENVASRQERVNKLDELEARELEKTVLGEILLYGLLPI